MAFFSSRPVEIEAMRFMGVHDTDLEAFADDQARRVWVSEDGKVAEFDMHLGGYTPAYEITTLEGTMLCRSGDWIIKGTEGEFYPCKDSVFQRKYQPTEEQG